MTRKRKSTPPLASGTDAPAFWQFHGFAERLARSKARHLVPPNVKPTTRTNLQWLLQKPLDSMNAAGNACDVRYQPLKGAPAGALPGPYRLRIRRGDISRASSRRAAPAARAGSSAGSDDSLGQAQPACGSTER